MEGDGEVRGLTGRWYGRRRRGERVNGEMVWKETAR